MENWHTTEQRRVRKCTHESLVYTIEDCRQAIHANPDNPKCGQYMDTIHYCNAELKRRTQ